MRALNGTPKERKRIPSRERVLQGLLRTGDYSRTERGIAEETIFGGYGEGSGVWNFKFAKMRENSTQKKVRG